MSSILCRRASKKVPPIGPCSLRSSYGERREEGKKEQTLASLYDLLRGGEGGGEARELPYSLIR